MRDLRELPKAELHIHLEGSMRIATLRELADRDGVPVPPTLGEDDRWRFEDSLEFIESYLTLCRLLETPEDFRRLGYECCAELSATGVRYAEAVFSPGNHAKRAGDWHGPIEAVLDGLAAGERDHGVTVRLCPDIVRDDGLEDAERTLAVALRYAGRGVVALGAAGSERTGIEPFADLFARATAAGLRSVPHAGEWAGPENVRATIAEYRPDRIGHGVRAIEDPALVVAIADLALPLELCPVSNVATGVYPSLAAHPFPALRAAGVVVTLNSDDPAMFGAWLTEVYAAAREAWDLTDEDLAGIALAAVDASFAEPPIRGELTAAIDAWLAEPVAAPQVPAIP